MTEIRHIVFDIGKVLIHYDPNLPYQRIIPDPDEEILHMARLRKGSLSQLTGGFVRQAMVSASAAIFFAAILLGWIYWFFRNAAEFTL